MSEQEQIQVSTNGRRTRQKKLNDAHTTTLQRPTNKNKEGWREYWNLVGQLWRIEPEIDKERQEYLEERRKITPNIEKGIYPFKDIEPKLNRADIEWLLATHDNGEGPILW